MENSECGQGVEQQELSPPVHVSINQNFEKTWKYLLKLNLDIPNDIDISLGNEHRRSEKKVQQCSQEHYV